MKITRTHAHWQTKQVSEHNWSPLTLATKIKRLRERYKGCPGIILDEPGTYSVCDGDSFYLCYNWEVGTIKTDAEWIEFSKLYKS